MLSQLCALCLQIDLSSNSIGGHEEDDGYDSDDPYDSDGDEKTEMRRRMEMRRHYAGVQAIADALGVNASLTRLNVSYNSMRDEGVKLLRDAVSGREGFELIDHRNE